MERYTRQIALSEIGLEGQHKLAAATVLCVGAGGLASHALPLLAATGVGHLVIADDDIVVLSNLQRQTLYITAQVGQKKILCAREHFLALNPEIAVTIHDTRLTLDNAETLVSDCDIVVDATDNFPARHAISDVCTRLRKPHVFASVKGFQGQAAVFVPHIAGPCYRCLVPIPPESTEPLNVLGSIPALLGTIQANETLKLILGIGKPLRSRMWHCDALTMRTREIAITPDPQCACQS